jgi:hypothetical protein
MGSLEKGRDFSDYYFVVKLENDYLFTRFLNVFNFGVLKVVYGFQRFKVRNESKNVIIWN